MMRKQTHHSERKNVISVSVTDSNVVDTQSRRRVGNDIKMNECRASGAIKYHVVFGFLLALISEVLWAGDIEAGKSKAAVCAGCHGSQGVSSIPGYPHLAGQKAGYLVASLKRFKNADAISPIMGPLAKSLSDEDISNLAAFYSSLNRCK